MDIDFDENGKRIEELNPTTELETLDDIVSDYISQTSSGRTLEEALEDKYVAAQFVPLDDALPGLGKIVSTFPINQKLIL